MEQNSMNSMLKSSSAPTFLNHPKRNLFFYRRSSFFTYKTIGDIHVQFASVVTKIFGNGLVNLLIGGASNITSVVLFDDYEIVFSRPIRSYRACFFKAVCWAIKMNVGSCYETTVVFDTKTDKRGIQ